MGIHLHNKDGAWTEVNNLQHIRMENVKTGILFSTEGWGYIKLNEKGLGDSLGHCYINGVGIELRNTSDAVGIQIGDESRYKPGFEMVQGTIPPNMYKVDAKPYFAFLKANVWLGPAGGCGIRLINGEIKHCLVNVGVQGHGAGIGLDVSNATAIVDSPITKNQTANPSSNMKGFLLYADGLSQPIKNKSLPLGLDVTVISP